MPLDHFVSQVHLKKFYSPELGNRMWAIRKGDLKTFTPTSESVCRIESGSTNPYLTESRVIEEFLRTIEPAYNPAISKLLENAPDVECVYAIAGFVAYVAACSPGGMRIQSAPLRGSVEEVARVLEKTGKLPEPPSVLGSSTLSGLLESGGVTVSIDPKYPQAIGIWNILALTQMFGNCFWNILVNPYEDSPFFTSDFPVAIEATGSPVCNRIVPLTPSLAIRIEPDPRVDRTSIDLSFHGFSYKRTTLRRKEVGTVNRLIVRCAEEVVFFRDNHPWIYEFVKKNARYRIEAINRRIPRGKGALLLSSLEVVERS